MQADANNDTSSPTQNTENETEGSSLVGDGQEQNSLTKQETN